MTNQPDIPRECPHNTTHAQQAIRILLCWPMIKLSSATCVKRKPDSCQSKRIRQYMTVSRYSLLTRKYILLFTQLVLSFLAGNRNFESYMPTALIVLQFYIVHIVYIQNTQTLTRYSGYHLHYIKFTYAVLS